jgi:hypothetical protein
MCKLNIKIFLIIFFSVFFLGMTFILFSPLVLAAESSGGGIVPCGTDSTGPCTLCHFIIGIQNLVQYGLYLVTTMAFVGIFIGGAMYMISVGDSAMIESAKRFIGASLVGFALVLGAWLIVNIILNVMPVRQNLGIGKTNWYTFKCDTTSTQGSGKNDGSTGSTPTPTSTNVNDQICGLSNKGKCFKGVSVVAACPEGYSPALGSATNPCPSTYNCCEPNGLPTSSVGRCGINNAGECKSGVINCPSGWTSTMGNPTNPCKSGSKCCVKDGESSETCRKPFSTITGKCFYGTSSCPSGWDHPWFGTCSASQSICCIKK